METRFTRRTLLTAASIFLGDKLVNTLAKPVGRWGGPLRLEAAQLPSAGAQPATSPVIFVDAAKEAGVTIQNVWGGITHKDYIVEAKGCGIAFFDYDQDGWLDIYLTNGTRLKSDVQPDWPQGRAPSLTDPDYLAKADVTWPPGQTPHTHLLKNNRDGTFTDVTEKSGLARSGWQTGVCVGDYDNDGWDDLFLTFWGHNVLFHNNGDGTFTDVTKKAGLWKDEIRWGSGCCFLDYDRDGSLDLFVANYIVLDLAKVPKPGQTGYCQWKGIPVMCGPRGLPGGSNLLYHNNGNGTFTDVSEKAGILATGPRYSITPVSYDFDNDGWPDIYVSVDSEPSILFHNNHNGTFTDVGVMAGVAYNEDGQEQAGMGVGVGDYDCDGNLDIFKTNFSDDTCDLYHNNGDGTFQDVTFVSGVGVNTQVVGWGCGFIDYDNDGWPDIFQANGHVYPEIDKLHLDQTFKEPRIVYHNLGNGKFKDVSKMMGTGVTAKHSSRGAAFGDYNNDGCVDVLILNMNETPSLLRNEGGNKKNWIKLKLIGTHCNRTAIGARAYVTTGKHRQMNEVASGGSVMSQSDFRLHFGLGRAPYADLIEIKWPTTWKIDRFTRVKANQIVTIKEGAGIVKQEPGRA